MCEAIVETLRAYRPDWEKKLKIESKTQLAALANARKEGTIPTPSKSE